MKEITKLTQFGSDFHHSNRTILDLIDQGILILDSRGRIRDANKWFLDMTALVRTSVVSRTVEDFVHDLLTSGHWHP